MPAPTLTPTHSAAARMLKPIKRSQPMRMAPANGGASIDKPGTNFAITKELVEIVSGAEALK